MTLQEKMTEFKKKFEATAPKEVLEKLSSAAR